MFSSSITRFMTTALAVLMAGLFVAALILAVRAWSNFETAGQIARLSTIDHALFNAQVEVRAQVPANSMALIGRDDPAPVIDGSFQLTARAVAVALAALHGAEIPDSATHVARIEKSWRRMVTLQEEVLHQAGFPRPLRTLLALDPWRSSVHELIDALSMASASVNNAVRIGDAPIAELVQVRQTAWTIRDRYGLQCSALRLNIETAQPLGLATRDRWIGDRAVYASAWQTLDELLTRPGISQPLVHLAGDAHRATSAAQSRINQIVEALDDTGNPGVTGTQWTALCDGPFDAVLAIAREAQVEAIARADNLRHTAIRILLIAGIDLTAVVAFGAFAVVIVRRRFARPMRMLTSTIARLSRREYEQPVQVTGSLDELGSMARALEELRTSALETERLQQAMSRFTADASHQMRTPLTILHTHLSVLDTLVPEQHAARASLADIREAAARLQRLLIQLLKLARAEGAQAEEPDGSDLREVVQDTAREFVRPALEAGIDLHFEADDGALPARASRIVIHELLSNLIDNAIRYNSRGGHVTIRLRRGMRGGSEIEIEDDGPGIPAHEHAQVMTRFYRLKRDQGRAGSGLGLAIVHSLMSSVGGRLTMGPGAEGQGLKVQLELP